MKDAWRKIGQADQQNYEEKQLSRVITDMNDVKMITPSMLE